MYPREEEHLQTDPLGTNKETLTEIVRGVKFVERIRDANPRSVGYRRSISQDIPHGLSAPDMSNMNLFTNAHHPYVVNFMRHRLFVVLLRFWDVAALNYKRNYLLESFRLLFTILYQ